MGSVINSGIIIVFSLYVLTSCSNKQIANDIGKKNVVFDIVNYDIELGYHSSEVEYKVIKEESKDEISYVYLGELDTFKISLILNNSDTIASFHSKLGNIRLDKEKSKQITYNEKKFSIIKFSLNQGSIDGKKSIFFDQQIGILIYRNDSWIHVKELKSFRGQNFFYTLISIIKEDPHFYFDDMIFNVPKPPPSEDLFK